MLAKLVNLALLGLFPLAWQAPLARAGVPWLFYAEEISIFSGVLHLWKQDLPLGVIVAFFAVVAPYCKTIALIYVQFSDRESTDKTLPVLEVLGRLSMVDVFLIALYVLVVTGLESIEIAWGLYFFTALVLASIWSSYVTFKTRFEIRARPRSHDESSV